MELLDVLTPLLILGAVAVGMPSRWLRDPRGQAMVVAGLAALVARYLWWRFTVTVWPAEDFSVQTAFVWTLFLVELVAWFDAGLLFAALLRRTQRSGEADAGEARLKATLPCELPTVDVLITTYNEPIEVLERTIIGALAIDWPSDRIKVWVLDDGKRDWLRTFCAKKSVRYLTRPDNSHAKAGNINAALQRTRGEFFMVLDADFIPQKNFLFRAMGLFEDPKVGIVQIPHSFFNCDPMQTNLLLHKALPEDQRLFFDAIMPGRDGWDCAFCCGSNSITRRAAIQAVGGGLPTGSVTEDILLTLTMLRKGFKTRYLNERLAVGLAPESLSAFFVQRARWARGGIQILFLKEGPFGPGLKLHQRLFFLPTHWLSQSLSQTMAMATPAIYLWTGILPLLNANTASVISYQVPAILGAIAAIRLLAPHEFFPLASTAHSILQAFRLLPIVLATLIKPYGHAFKVTPKGSGVGNGATVDAITVALALGILAATAFGLLLNASFNNQIITSDGLVPIVAFWSILNMIVLTIVATTAISPPRLRSEERFEVDEPCRILLRRDEEIAPASGEMLDLSLSGTLIRLSIDAKLSPQEDEWVLVEVAGVGRIPALVRRCIPDEDGTVRVGANFDLPVSSQRDRLIEKLFTEGIDNSVDAHSAWAITWGMISRIFRSDVAPVACPRQNTQVPDWVRQLAGPSDPNLSAAVAWTADVAAPQDRATATCSTPRLLPAP